MHKNNPALSFNKPKGEFTADLNRAVENYFASQPEKTRRANKKMVLKLVQILALFTGSYLWLVLGYSKGWWQLLPLFLFANATLLMAFSIGHDASHNALFNNQKRNRLFAMTFNLIGVNAYIWNIKHNRSHHTYTNIPGYDMDIEQIKIARLVDHVPLKKHYRFQHLYVPLLYPFASLYMVLIKDFQMFATARFGITPMQHERREYLILFVSKLFYFFYMLVVPIALLPIPATIVVLGFIGMHLYMGTIIATVLFPAHALESSPFPQPDASGQVDYNWMELQIKTTISFSTNNAFVTWYTGGLNLHVTHHLFPGVCHIHYPALSAIVKSTCEKHHFVYREMSLWDALRSHLQLLKHMGQNEKNQLSHEKDNSLHYA